MQNVSSRNRAITERSESQRKIIHIDMDAFFASIEQRDHPQWRGRPLIVGGDPDGRGVVAAASYEARAFGIRSAMPARRARALCPDAIFVRPRIDVYREVSARIMNIFHRYTDLVEPLSLDEACLDVTHNHAGQPLARRLAQQIRGDILRETGLTASAGIAPNRFLAKVAADLRKPNQQTVIPPERVGRLMRDLPVARIPGVGPVMQKRLEALGIVTAGQLQEWDETKLVAQFGRFGLVLYERCRGIDNRPVGLPRRRKSVSVETTFAQDLTAVTELRSALDELCRRLLQRADRLDWRVQSITVKCRYADFRTVTRRRTLSPPGELSVVRVQAQQLLAQVLEERQAPIRLLGVGITPPDPQRSRQLVLPYDGQTNDPDI